MYRSILVPLDGSAFGESALPMAITIARATKARLNLVHVHVPLVAIYADLMPNVESSIEPAMRERSREYLNGVVKRLSANSDVPITSVLLEGPVADAINHQAESMRPDLVVLARHGRGPFARVWLGSVADELVRRMKAPLLLVRPPVRPVDLNLKAEINRFLIPLDGSEFAEQVLPAAMALGEVFRPAFTLMRVVPPMVLGSSEVMDTAMGQVDPIVIERLRELHDNELQSAQAYLDRMAKPMRERGFVVNTIAVSDEKAAVAILAEAKEQSADLVALATHGRSGLGRMFLGSVADKVLRASHGPVLVLRPEKKD